MSYSTEWKFEVANGLIPSQELASYPKSTVSKFKNSNHDTFDRIVGFKYMSSHQSIEADFYQTKRVVVQSTTFNKSLLALVRVKRCLLKIKSFSKRLRNSIQTKERIVHTISRVKKHITLKRALRLFRISKSTFDNWKFQVKYQCGSSFEKLCYKRFVTQISKEEVITLKNLLKEKAALFWPLSSIWGYARKNDILHCSLSSFYKWSRAIHPELFSNKFKKLRKEGFKTFRPNEVWHCDVTQFKTKDNVKSHIYILIDNFSKMILNFKIASKVDSAVCSSLIEEAVSKHQAVFSKLTMPDLFPLINLNLSKESSFVHLMTDGGSENQGQVNRIIFDKNLPINKITAGKDVTFSNSPIEALNKIVKYQQLYLLDIPNQEALIQKLTEWIPIYNQERPNRAGRYLLTPQEIYEGVSVDSKLLKKQMKNAKKERISKNKKTSCGVC